MRKFVLPLLVLSALGGISCDRSPAATQFESRNFATPNYNLLLCLDLTTDLAPAAGLLVNGNPNLPLGQHYVVLPFESLSAQSNEDIVSTWGSYSNFTLVTYLASERMNTDNGVGITPRLRIYAPDELLGNEASREPVYLIASGEERKLVFRYPHLDQNTMHLPPQLQKLSLEIPDGIAVMLPPNARRFGNTVFLTEQPQHELEKGDLRIRYYPGTFERAKADTLELMYVVKPNFFQNLLVEYLFKLVPILIVPALTLKFLRKEEVDDANKRKWWLRFLLVLQVVIGVTLLVFFIVKGASDTNIKLALDTVLLIGGALIAQFVASMKVSDKPKQKPA